MKSRADIDFGEMGARVGAGAKLAGTVTFPSGKLESVSAYVQWRTHGRGDSDQGKALAVTLKAAPRSLRGLAVGAPNGPPSSVAGAHMMWFEVEIPREPLSYQGQIINIQWYLVLQYQFNGDSTTDEFEFLVERPSGDIRSID